ncbi:hypothetical protein CLOM_g23289, partial [Closterium sp. NIES-68]
LNIGIARNGSVQLSLGVVDHLLLRRDLFLNAVGIRESLLLLRQESLRPRRLTDHVVQNPLRIRLRRDRRLQSRLRGVDHIGARAARLGHEVRLRLGVRGVEGREQARGDDQEGQQESGTSRHGDDEKRGVAGLAWVTDREW